MRLTPQLHKHIISFLCEITAARTIANCALVCRDWLLFTQSKLYGDIYLDCWHRYAYFMLVPSPDIVSCLQGTTSLQIGPESACHRWGHNSQHLGACKRREEQPWTHFALQQGAPLLTSLTSLMLYQVDWRTRWFDYNLLYSGGSSYYKSITRLELRRCSFLNVHQVQQLVLAFPALSKLILGKEVEFDTNPFQESHPIPRGPPLKYLYLHSDDPTLVELVQFLIAAHSVQRLTELHWRPYWKNEDIDETLCDLVKAIDGSLEHLVVYPYTRGLINLSSHTNLRSFCIKGLSTSFVDGFGLLSQILTRLSTNKLERLEVDLDPMDQRLARNCTWLKDMDKFLTRAQFSSLRCFEMTVRFKLTAANMYDILNSTPTPGAARSTSQLTSSGLGNSSPFMEDAYKIGEDRDKATLDRRPSERVEELIRHEIQTTMERLSSRNILRLRIIITELASGFEVPYTRVSIIDGPAEQEEMSDIDTTSSVVSEEWVDAKESILVQSDLANSRLVDWVYL